MSKAFWTIKMNHFYITGAHLEQAINEADIIVAVMRDRNFEEFRDKVEVELELAKELLDKITSSFEPVKVRSYHGFKRRKLSELGNLFQNGMLVLIILLQLFGEILTCNFSL